MGYWLKDGYRKQILGGGETWRGAVIDFEKYRAAYDSLEPDCILYRDEFYPSGGRPLTAALKEKDLLLIGVQHGMINRDHTVYQWHRRDIPTPVATSTPDHVHCAPVPDYFSSFGEYYVEQFERWGGYPSSNVIPIGGLRHDGLVERFGDQDPETENRIRLEYNLPAGCPILLLCTGLAIQAGEWFRMAVKAIQNLDSEVFVVVKLHPYHGGEDQVRRVAEQQLFESYTIRDEAIYPLMAASDILVTGSSTTVLEAGLLGLSTVAITANRDCATYPFEGEQIAEVATNAEEMKEALRRTFEEEERVSKADLGRHLRNLDKGACNRIAGFIKRHVSR